jgi:acetylornithine deacetylase/succinyl-diaminopimelate desuccinylase-like protein
MTTEPAAASTASVAASAPGASSAPGAGLDEAVDAYLRETRERRLAEYTEFLRIPSISALPENAGDCRAAAEWLARRLEAIGLEHVEVSETGGHPIVYADWLHAEPVHAAPAGQVARATATTAVVYGHYDVQPVDPLDEWTSPPFEPVIVGDRILARGASDDKGNIAIILQAADALLKTRGALPINVRFVFEGEEESSSVHLDPWLAANTQRLTGDVALICDAGFFAGNVPAITTALRGIAYIQIDVAGPFQDLHSGSFGGIVANPANALAQIIASLKGPDGRILVPGFYDDVVPLGPEARMAFADLPFDEPKATKMLGVTEFVGEPGYTTLERRAGRPTLDVNGIWAGFQGEGGKTIIPGRAHAKVSCRLVANQDPDRIIALLRAHIATVTPKGVTVEVHDLGTGRPSFSPIDLPANKALARSMAAVFGREPVYVMEGGSIPFVAAFETLLHLPVVIMGFVPPDGNFHAPNEWMHLGNFEAGIRTMARFWDELATLPG